MMRTKWIGRLHAILYLLIVILAVSIVVYANSDNDDEDNDKPEGKGDDDDDDQEANDDDAGQERQAEERDFDTEEMEETNGGDGEKEQEEVDDVEAKTDGVEDDKNAANAASSSDRLIRRLWLIHGLCAATAWAILVPLAVASSLLRHLLEHYCKLAWFPIHRLFNGSAIVLTIVAIVFAVIAYSYDDDGPHFVDEPHHLIGLLIGIGSFLQGLNGLLRPHLPHPPPPAEPPRATPAVVGGLAAGSEAESPTNSDVNDDDDNDRQNTTRQQHVTLTAAKVAEGKSTIRILWEYLHRILGLTLLATSWWQVQSGIYLFADEFNETDDESTPPQQQQQQQQRDYRSIFFAVIGSLTGMVLLLYACQSAMIGRRNAQ